jgi:hypothetical protein
MVILILKVNKKGKEVLMSGSPTRTRFMSHGRLSGVVRLGQRVPVAPRVDAELDEVEGQASFFRTRLVVGGGTARPARRRSSAG